MTGVRTHVYHRRKRGPIGRDTEGSKIAGSRRVQSSRPSCNLRALRRYIAKTRRNRDSSGSPSSCIVSATPTAAIAKSTRAVDLAMEQPPAHRCQRCLRYRAIPRRHLYQTGKGTHRNPTKLERHRGPRTVFPLTNDWRCSRILAPRYVGRSALEQPASQSRDLPSPCSRAWSEPSRYKWVRALYVLHPPGSGWRAVRVHSASQCVSFPLSTRRSIYENLDKHVAIDRHSTRSRTWRRGTG